jgi:hypothetical protein
MNPRTRQKRARGDCAQALAQVGASYTPMPLFSYMARPTAIR